MKYDKLPLGEKMRVYLSFLNPESLSPDERLAHRLMRAYYASEEALREEARAHEVAQDHGRAMQDLLRADDARAKAEVEMGNLLDLLIHREMRRYAGG